MSKLHGFRGLLRFTLPLGFFAMTGCASVIQSLPQSDDPRLSNSPQRPTVPSASAKAKAYESPIPRWNSAYQGAVPGQSDKKRLARTYRALDVVDGVNEFLAQIGNPDGDAHLTPLAIAFCMSGGAPHRREKDWWGNTFSLQPGGLASSIFEGRLKGKCELSYRRRYMAEH